MRTLLTVCLLLTTLSISAQSKDFKYDLLDSDHNVVTSKNKAKYYRYLFDDARFKIYRKSTGMLKVSGTYLSTDEQVYHGDISFFDKVGNEWVYTYENGEKVEFPIFTIELIDGYKPINTVNYSLNTTLTFTNSINNCIDRAKSILEQEAKSIGGDSIFAFKIEQMRDGDDVHIIVYGTAAKKLEE